MMKFNAPLMPILLAGLIFASACTEQKDVLKQAYEKKQGSYPVRTHHLDSAGNPTYINRLIQQDSLYLLQHAHNPVDWWSWSDEAFAKARELDKPILLSIGYSTCHWCHVMERESFENPEIAKFINQNFIAIKVDREEHPDVDELYLTAVQMLSGKAGWPLTAVITPDGLPFFGGTYFPADQFLSLLHKVSDTWMQKRGAIMEQAERLKTSLDKINQSAGTAKAVDDELLAQAQQKIINSFAENQGINQAAFAREPEMLFLLDQAIKKLDDKPLTAVHQRLITLANGGIHDQLSGGFHRYSVDSQWQVPHFEKMLYNQAQLGELYALAYMQSGDPALRLISESTFDFLLRDMQAPEGGFYSAMDAESDGREGAFYLWSFDELKELLTNQELVLAQSIYGVSAQGNFAGENVLVRKKEVQEEQQERFKSLNEKLLAARKQRASPLVDTKVITAWNGLAISALISGFQATGQKHYREAAMLAAQRIWEKSFSKKKGLARTIASKEGRVNGTLDDYAYFARALLDLYDLEADEIWLERAQQITEQMRSRFHDEKTGGFYISNNNLVTSLVTARDDALNSGNSVAAQVLVRLHRRVGKAEYRRSVQGVLAAFSSQLHANPQSLSGMLIAASQLNQGEIGSVQYAAKGKVRVKTEVINAQLKIMVDIVPGWHINSYKVLQDDLIPTSLSLATGQCASITEVNYPRDKRVTLGFQNEQLAVYEDQAMITAKVDINQSIDCPILALELHVQACSDEVCLSPETMQLRIPLLEPE